MCFFFIFFSNYSARMLKLVIIIIHNLNIYSTFVLFIENIHTSMYFGKTNKNITYGLYKKKKFPCVYLTRNHFCLQSHES